MKPTIWIFSIEPIDTRYTKQWHKHFPELLTSTLGSQFNIVQVDGVQKNSTPTPGAFLNFSDTNYWKSSQLCKFLEHHNNGETSVNDHFIFTDAWNPTILQLKYMSQLLGFNWTIHGLWHAGSYDPQDFLGRIIGNDPWVRHSEKGMFHAIDHNYFATDFHIEMFLNNLFGTSRTYRLVSPEQVWYDIKKIVRSGWPMEYMAETLKPASMEKQDLILFPHRIAPEKQVEIFRDLASHLPQYEFVVCQEQTLTKQEYHNLLGQAKIVFSANLQETLGISCYEGALVDAIPMVPDRLSYKEMYLEGFKYPSHWTDSWDHYVANRDQLIHHIVVTMSHYEKRVPEVRTQAQQLSKDFFNASQLIENIKNGS